ncbi:MAG TPA: M28 family peptidase [Candidatus Limihabitans stercoravium]|nr:M28 family peptidase [Candidatus Limihabitans stercoravium]
MRVCAFILALLMCVAAVVPFTAVASEQVITNKDFGNYQTMDVYKFVEEFSTRFPSRIAGTETERQAAQYIKQQFETILPTEQSSVELQSINGESYNVVATLTSPVSQGYRIIIGAHYDSVLGSEGAQDNASGVAALLEIAKRLVTFDRHFDVDIVFVAFGSEELGLVGSQYFADSMSSIDVERTLMMINMDSIAGGDNLYLHCETVSNDMEKFFIANSPDYSELYVKPYSNGVVAMPSILGGYYETLLNADQAVFRAKGIPTALFISGNYSTMAWDYIESTDKSFCVMNSTSDTFANLSRRQAEFVKKIETVTDTIVNTIVAEGFITMAKNARNGLVNLDIVYSTRLPLLVKLVALIVLAVFAWRYYKKLQKNSYINKSSAQGTGNKVFVTPDADDVFDL